MARFWDERAREDPFFRGFVIRVFDPTTNTLLRTATQWEVGWTYTYEMNAQDAPLMKRTASRTFRVEVSIRDYLGRDSKPAKITVSNPVPKTPVPTLRTTPNFLYVEYQAGGASCEANALVRHSGQEYGLVLSGTLEVTLGFETYILEAEDSISFDSTIPHRLATVGDAPVRAVWVVAGRLGDSRVS